MTQKLKKNEQYFIDLYENGLILVDRTGKVTNPKTGNVLGTKPNSAGYNAIGWKENRKTVHILVHRLVYIIYGSGFPKGKPFVNHKDCNKNNNHIDNLEAVSNQENAIHARKNGLYTLSEEQRKNMSEQRSGANSPTSKLTHEQAIEIIKNYKDGKTRYRDIAQMYKVERYIIKDILRGKTYRNAWKFVNETFY